jgi:hypothetical protein
VEIEGLAFDLVADNPILSDGGKIADLPAIYKQLHRTYAVPLPVRNPPRTPAQIDSAGREHHR